MLMGLAAISPLVWELSILVGCLIASGFFSGSETALFTLSRDQQLRIRQSDGMTARLLTTLTARPRRLLNTLLFGNMLVNVTFSASAAVLVLDLREHHIAGWVLIPATIAPLLALIFFGEVAPKMLAYSIGVQWAHAVAVPLMILQRLFVPFQWTMEKVLTDPMTRILAPRQEGQSDITTEELASLMRLSAQQGVLDHNASDMLQEIVELTDVRAADVMVPRVDIIAHDVADLSGSLADLFRKTHLRKVPVYDGDLDHILGIVHAKRLLLNPSRSLEELVRPISYLPEMANLERVLLHFRKTHSQMAIVVDEYGGTAGLITLEDVLEEIVGDIPDRDEEPEELVERISEREYMLSGDLSIRDWGEAFGADPAPGRVSTLGGFVTALLGHIPRNGETIHYRNLRFTIESVHGRRVHRVRLELRKGES